MKNEYSLMKELKRLRSVRGQGTELISVYIPSGAQLFDTVGKLKEELNQSGNIKSSSTRKNVQAAIEKILSYLRLYRETPKNGLAVFCGNISKIPGREEIELFSIDPPLPLKVSMYRCDSDFMLEPIEDMVDAKDTFALVVMDGREATIATLKGPQIRIVRRLNSMAHAKVRKGGQSARRFERLREEGIEDFHKRIGSSLNDLFAQSEFKIKGVIVGGPGPAKEGFVKSENLNYQIKILGVYNTGYTDEYGLHELVESAKELLQQQEASKERSIIERFMHEISREGQVLAVRGYADTIQVVDSKKAGTVIMNKDLDLFEEFRKNASEQTVIVVYKIDRTELKIPLFAQDITSGEKSPAIEEAVREINKGAKSDVPVPPADANRLYKRLTELCPIMVEQRDAIEEMIKKAEENGVQIEFVSSESSYGKQFLMGFSGIGAILRYK
ncbi:MAG: peptide chain release factor aRF-1 [Candidatus Micrarchaeota archaeon]|nr:peptide chain release factor aRF-1 [Candidatus Micrarchaeota archaeon]MDE1847575.1 peptide chain release factor aRF-1 [Candidatus Micrarchaeota archaeon]MDE1864292.1 peptide chain release factor aRF-1 [Candidatus Micrarchaeota archaeon]